MKPRITHVAIAYAFLLFFTTPALMSMESPSEIQQSETQQKKLRKELDIEKKTLRMHEGIKKELLDYLGKIERENQRSLEKSLSKQKWLQKHPGKTIDDYNKKLTIDEESARKDLYNTNQLIEQTTHTIDSLQKRLEPPHIKEFTLDIE